MNINYAILAVTGVALLFIFLWRVKQVSPENAEQYLRLGAIVIDVRTREEFAAGHLPTAINLPLQDIDTLLPRRIQDKNKLLLLHCQSGMRSALAVKRLTNMGYTRVYNLGSYTRAEQLMTLM
jgi:rhodanese-related sulfurtransferase